MFIGQQNLYNNILTSIFFNSREIVDCSMSRKLLKNTQWSSFAVEQNTFIKNFMLNIIFSSYSIISNVCLKC